MLSWNHVEIVRRSAISYCRMGLVGVSQLSALGSEHLLWARVWGKMECIPPVLTAGQSMLDIDHKQLVPFSSFLSIQSFGLINALLSCASSTHIHHAFTRCQIFHENFQDVISIITVSTSPTAIQCKYLGQKRDSRCIHSECLKDAYCKGNSIYFNISFKSDEN